MTLIITVILALFCHPDASPNRHPDESQDLRFLAITQIPDQVRNDSTAVILTLIITVIPELNSGQALTKVRIGVLVFLRQILNQVQNDAIRGCYSDANRGCHSDESQNLRFLTITQILNQVQNDG
jgi:hypothetical protein